jgi:hypothetical protein
VNQFVLLGTTIDVPTGTRSSCYRGPKSDETSWHSTTWRGRNFTNLESFGFFLTRSRVFRPVGKRRRPSVNSHQRARTGHRCGKDGSRPRNWTAAELGADRASQWFSAPKELLQSAELSARPTLPVFRFGRANSSSIASGLRDHSKIASFGRGICIAIGHGSLFTIEILHDDGGAA